MVKFGLDYVVGNEDLTFVSFSFVYEGLNIMEGVNCLQVRE